jgi:hypothetical protein
MKTPAWELHLYTAVWRARGPDVVYRGFLCLRQPFLTQEQGKGSTTRGPAGKLEQIDGEQGLPCSSTTSTRSHGYRDRRRGTASAQRSEAAASSVTGPVASLRRRLRSPPSPDRSCSRSSSVSSQYGAAAEGGLSWSKRKSPTDSIDDCRTNCVLPMLYHRCLSPCCDRASPKYWSKHRTVNSVVGFAMKRKGMA